MANPTPYVPDYDFSGYQASNPTLPLPGDRVDTELANIQNTTDDLISAVGDVRRSDGSLQNELVTPESLSAETRALLLSDNFSYEGVWVTATAYEANDLVVYESATYLCVSAHVSNIFATDLSGGKWVLIASPYSLSGAVFTQVFDGTGAQVDFTLSQAFAAITDILVFVRDGSGGYELQRMAGASPQVSLPAPTTLRFATAPASGTANVLALAINNTSASSAAAAAASATAADASADAAAASETAAAASASAAATAETNAETAEANAEIAEANAAASAAAAAAAVAGALQASSNLSDVASAATAFGNIKQAATETSTGVVELATQAEVTTGTDATRVVTPATLAGRDPALVTVDTGADEVFIRDATDGLEKLVAASAFGATAASQAEMETATSTSVFVTPGRQIHHPAHPKAWVNFNGTGTVAIRADYGVSSITDHGTGEYSVSFDTAFSSANYLAIGICDRTINTTQATEGIQTVTFGTSAFRFICASAVPTATDQEYVGIAFWGDQ